MSTYRYTLSDYHAVKDADIIIDGLTILAGENGCGKSTLSRWLYYLVNGVQQFEKFTIRNFVERVDSLISRQNIAAREMRFYVKKDDLSQSKGVASVGQNLVRRYSTSDNDENAVRQAQDDFVQSVHRVADLLAEYLENSKKGARRDRTLMFLHMDSVEASQKDAKQVAEDYVEKQMRMLGRMTDKLYEDIEHRPFERFLENVRSQYDEEDAAPEKMQLYEDDVELIDEGRVSSLFRLHRAIYIDTPMALTNESAENVFWNELRNLVLQRKQVQGKSEKILLHRIKNILHGEARLVEKDLPFGDEELRFVSTDGRVNIEIEKAATGFKTFTYLQRLLENGYLGEDNLLLIDEPEAHLHPQWIVEYARLLVMLHKFLGLKVMVATHNPDMVAALRAIAEHEQVLNKTHFYIAEQTAQDGCYSYKNLGGDISEVFTSFNIALSRIESYGTSSF